MRYESFYPSAWADQRGPLGVKKLLLGSINITLSGFGVRQFACIKAFYWRHNNYINRRYLVDGVHVENAW